MTVRYGLTLRAPNNSRFPIDHKAPVSTAAPTTEAPVDLRTGPRSTEHLLPSRTTDHWRPAGQFAAIAGGGDGMRICASVNNPIARALPRQSQRRLSISIFHQRMSAPDRLGSCKIVPKEVSSSLSPRRTPHRQSATKPQFTACPGIPRCLILTRVLPVSRTQVTACCEVRRGCHDGGSSVYITMVLTITWRLTVSTPMSPRRHGPDPPLTTLVRMELTDPLRFSLTLAPQPQSGYSLVLTARACLPDLGGGHPALERGSVAAHDTT